MPCLWNASEMLHVETLENASKRLSSLYFFARSCVPNAGEPKGYGGIGIEIKIGGQVVRTGDWIIGDENGLIVVPKEKAVEVANRALAVHENENRTREEIRRGSTLSKVNELCKWEPVK